MRVVNGLSVLRDRSKQTRARIVNVVDPLTDEQLAWRPNPRAHSIGFTLWHTARADDNVQLDLTGAPLEWERGEWARRWGHPERGVGTGWDDERAAALPLPPRAELLDYVRRVFGSVDTALDAIEDARLDTALKSRFMGGDSTVGEVIGACVTHDNRHLGEIEYIKGLLGLRGTATI